MKSVIIEVVSYEDLELNLSKIKDCLVEIFLLPEVDGLRLMEKSKYFLN